MLYDQIKNSNIPVASTIRKIPSREDQRFDELVQRLLYAGGRLDPTVYGLPHPLTFHVNDARPHGANKSMVESLRLLRRNAELRDRHRRVSPPCPALRGIHAFPRPDAGHRGVRRVIESQIDCLSKFAEEMHAIRGLAAEIPIDLPIAVCVSKMDLLVSQEPDGHPGHSARDAPCASR